MHERVVINTGPIISLARAEALGLLARLGLDFISPKQVWAEIEAGASSGHSVIWPECVGILTLANPPDPVAVATLDEGEAAVIQLAMEQRVEYVCVDDRKGRRAAMAVGLKVTGSLGLLARAKTLGVVSAVRPITNRLIREGVWYDLDLLERVLRELGE